MNQMGINWYSAGMAMSVVKCLHTDIALHSFRVQVFFYFLLTQLSCSYSDNASLELIIFRTIVSHHVCASTHSAGSQFVSATNFQKMLPEN